MSKLDPNNALDAFIIENMAAHPDERRLLRKLYRTLAKAGNPIVNVWDGEEDNPITDETEFFRIAFNLDEFRADTQDDRFVAIVMGEGWESMPNYSASLEDTLQPVSDLIDKNLD